MQERVRAHFRSHCRVHTLANTRMQTHTHIETGRLLYLRIIMRDVGFPQQGPWYLYEDSRVVICMAENPTGKATAREHAISMRVITW